MRHIKPMVAREVEKGPETDVRLESTPFGYPVVDKSRESRLSPGEVTLEVDPDLLAVRDSRMGEGSTGGCRG